MNWILRLYPRTWRERYEEEMLALLEQHRITWRTRVDLLCGAWDAQLSSAFGREPMSASSSPSSRPVTLAGGTLVGIMLVFGLMFYGIHSYPSSVSGAGLTSLLQSMAGLLVYASAGVWGWRYSRAPMRTALAQGAKFGAILACGDVVNMVLEHFAALGTTGDMIVGVGMWALMFVTFGAAGSAAYQRSGSLGLAVLASVWSALISTVTTLICGFALGVLFMPHMQQILSGEYAQSGMSDPRAFVIRHTLDAASSHLLLAPLLAGIFGTVGGYACSRLHSLQRSAAMIVGGLETGLLIGGITALRFAVFSLARPERPPFVMTGFLALGIAMACAHPVVSAIRRPATSV